MIFFSQSDTSSTGATKSTEDRLGTKLTDSPRSDRSRTNGTPDGESPKGFGQERRANFRNVVPNSFDILINFLPAQGMVDTSAHTYLL